MFAASVLLIWALDASLASEQSFNQLVSTLTSTAIKPVVWLVLVGGASRTISPPQESAMMSPARSGTSSLGKAGGTAK